MRVFSVVAALASTLVVAGCGGSSSAPQTPTIQPARTFELEGFEPSGEATPGTPTTVSFTIRQPSGAPLTNYRRGAGPHTGVHMIFVRSDLGAIIHHHPPIGADGKIDDTVTFPTPGTYRLVVDAYPNLAGPLRNFQLFRTVQVKGTAPKQPLPPFRSSEVVDGFKFTIHGRPNLRAIQAGTLDLTVTDPQGQPARFTPWFGALAHAIFFRAGSLDYFHTHVCAPGATGCTSLLGATSVTGTSTTPGQLHVGVLLPVSGTWRLFLQMKANGQIVTAPFTLKVR
jgi:hypothetical protein